ncbi:hypothetical protein HX785_13225 [Pseudomonas reactans]|uniref:hypothetical protein n=1 Tax=Pseudomonas reactans TaxID=117680 RepID=UPI00159FD44D|nr:hypothetical protein [Pseudomonas reactans]NWF14658.1 hypothetical protein [Pseudomonas reactans]
MREIAILKVDLAALVNNNELQLEGFKHGLEALLKLLAKGMKPVLVVQANNAVQANRTLVSPSALIGQTRVIAQWVAMLGAAHLVGAQLVVERGRSGGDVQLAQTVATLGVLTELGAIPILMHNELTWITGRSNTYGWDLAASLANAFRTTVVEPKQEGEQVRETDHVSA